MSLWYKAAVITLFMLFLTANAAYLHRVPGLMGDEASEGENVHLLSRARQPVVRGERSYIGPLVDYLRVPFIKFLGYTALAVRLPMLFFSLVSFTLAVVVFRRLWGDYTGLAAAAAMLFSPVYLLYQRLGWAITLSAFFTLLTLYFLTLPKESRFKKHGPLLAGIAAGLGAHNHILFLPVLAGITGGWLIAMLGQGHFRRIAGYWPAVIGFFAAFGTQLAVMAGDRAEFSDAAGSTSLFGDKVSDFPSLMPMILSGSSYIARYTGDELTPPLYMWITWILIALALSALIFSRRRRVGWAWAAALAVMTAAVLYIIVQFSLRYFVVPVLGMWALAGAGLGTIIVRLSKGRRQHLLAVSVIILAVGLTAWTAGQALIPYLKTGGSTGEFSLGNRNDSAAALADTGSLLRCIESAGPVYSKNVHIQNRLRFWSLNEKYNVEVVAANESKKRVRWVVYYRIEGKKYGDGQFEKCPQLKHWRVVARDKG